MFMDLLPKWVRKTETVFPTQISKVYNHISKIRIFDFDNALILQSLT